MSLGGILFLVLAIIALFVFIYLLVYSAGNWGVLHTLLLCFLFLECWGFMIFAAGVMRKRVGALAEYAKNKDDLDKLSADINKLTWGDPSAVSEELDSVVAYKSQLRRVTMDRGRVWRHVTLLDQTDNQFRLELAAPTTPAAPIAAPAAPAATTPAATPSPATPAPGTTSAPAQPTAPVQPAASTIPSATFEGLPVNMVVYGFAEAAQSPVGQASENDQAIPDFYLGEFKVVNYQARQVELRPTAPLEPNQIAYIQDGKANTWTLYEMLPLDGHQAYAAPESKPTLEFIFGRMDKATLEKLFASVPVEDSRQQKLIDRYLRDGQKAAADDPPDSVWVRIELLKDYVLDVDSTESANATVGGYFDSSGRSIDVRMKRGEGAKLEALKQLVVSEAVYKDLTDKGIAKLIERIFVRPLIAYEEAFSQLAIRRQTAIDHIALYERDKNVLTNSNALGQAMIADSQIEKQLLSQDLAMYQKEQSVVKSALAAMEAKLQQTKAELSHFYRELHARHP